MLQFLADSGLRERILRIILRDTVTASNLRGILQERESLAVLNPTELFGIGFRRLGFKGWKDACRRQFPRDLSYGVV